AGRLLGQLVRLLYEGKSFSQALEGFPAAFPPVYVALVRSSEETGSVSDALARYVGYRQRLDELRQKIIQPRSIPWYCCAWAAASCCFFWVMWCPASVWYSKAWRPNCRGCPVS